MRALIISHFYSDPKHRGKLRALAGLGVELMAALPGGSAILDSGIRLTPVPVSGDPEVPGMYRWNARALRRIISDFQPNLIQIEETPGSPAGGAAAGAARRMRIPYTILSWESQARRRGLLESLRYRSTLKHAAGVVGGNQLARDLLRREAPGALATALPQAGVSSAPPTSREGRPPGLSIGFVGRLVPERGGELLLKACTQLLGAWNLTMVGTGPEQESLEALAQRWGLASRIRWMGGVPRSELEPIWNDLDCLVVPSQDTPTWVERWSPLLLDAMARGIAPVVTRAGALPEIVGEAGIVVDGAESLAEALQELLGNPEHLALLGRRARQRILEEFVDSAVAQRTLTYWEQVLSHAQASAHTARARQT